MIITKKHVLSAVLLGLFACLQIFLFSLGSPSVSAQTNTTGGKTLFDQQEGMTEIGKVYGDSKTDVRVMVAKLIIVVLGFLGAIFLALIVYAGFRYMTAAGNQDQVKKAVAQIRDAVIGLVIVMAAWAITYFILRVINRAVNNSVQMF